MEELGPLTTAEGYVPKVACLFSLHVGTKSLFDCSKKTFEGRSPATFLICLPFPILRDWRISNDTALFCCFSGFWMFYLTESKYDRSHPKFKTTVLQNSPVYLCFIMQCMMPLWATTSVETNKGIRTKHEHRQPRKFCHAHITIIYIVSATKEILIKWGKKCVLVMPKATGKKDRMSECVCN